MIGYVTTLLTSVYRLISARRVNCEIAAQVALKAVRFPGPRYGPVAPLARHSLHYYSAPQVNDPTLQGLAKLFGVYYCRHPIC